MSEVVVVIERVKPRDAHDAQKCVKLLGKAEGSPESTWKTRNVYMAALVSKKTTLEAEMAMLKADVLEYYQNYLELQEVVKTL